MKIPETLKETAKIVKILSEDTISTLKALTEEKSVIDFKNMEVYEQIQILVKEGFVSKDYRNYSINSKGKELIQSVDYLKSEPEKYQKAIKEEVKKDNVFSVKYKKHDEKKNLIEDVTETFEIEKDGLPIIKVDEETYAHLIHRLRGQHWKDYLNEGARQLIRQKKLSRFYVEDEKTSRRYLYILP